MSKLTKAQAKAHQTACELLAKDTLTLDERWFVLENWQASARHINSTAGAFFTPRGLARDLAVEVSGRRVIDLCAGIGSLSFGMVTSCWQFFDVVCVEVNPDYIEVGRKVLPEALWICADVFDLPRLGLGHFDCAIANPPFGAVDRRGKRAPRFSGKDFEYHVIDLASDVAAYGVFILPQMSAPFRFSGCDRYREESSKKLDGFAKATAIQLTHGCGVDTSIYRDDWHGVAPNCEIVCADFEEAKAQRAANAEAELPLLERRGPAAVLRRRPRLASRAPVARFGPMSC